MSLDQVRAVADAVLYEGYLLYPYRAGARKNQARWQFGVVGPPGAAGAGVGEEPTMAVECLVGKGPGPDGATAPPGGDLSVRVHLRFLQLQTRTVERYDGRSGCYMPVDELVVGDERWLSWGEAVEQEVVLDWSADDLRHSVSREVPVDGHQDVEYLEAGTGGASRDDVPGGGDPAGRVVRRRWPMHARVTATITEDEGWTRLRVRVDNTSRDDPRGIDAGPRDLAARASLIGTHLILEAAGACFVSVIDPPRAAAAAARRCVQHRCWPVLAHERRDPDDPPDDRPEDQAVTSAVVLASPIILYDFPEVAAQSTGALLDSTEIDEILTLRGMTMAEEEKAEARATDPMAREIIDRCDDPPPPVLQQVHGVLRNPHASPARTTTPPAHEPGTRRGEDKAEEDE